MTFDPTKPVQTRDGQPARIICTDRKGGANGVRTIVALVTENGTETPRIFGANGEHFAQSNYDLTNTPERVERWANVMDTHVTASMPVKPPLSFGVSFGVRTALVRYIFEADCLVHVEIVPLEDKP